MSFREMETVPHSVHRGLTFPTFPLSILPADERCHAKEEDGNSQEGFFFRMIRFHSLITPLTVRVMHNPRQADLFISQRLDWIETRGTDGGI